MDSSQLGLVLKRFVPYKIKVSVLDQKKGKLILVSIPSDLIYKLWPGMIIKYYCLHNFSKNIIINKINIVAYQQYMTKKNLSWFYALLELCYYSLPLGLPAGDIFDFLCNSYLLIGKKNLFDFRFDIVKKIYLLKLIELLGLLSHEFSSFCPELMLLISNVFIDFSNKQKVESVNVMLDGINKTIEKQINISIKEILKKHPFYRNFKVNYLTELDF